MDKDSTYIVTNDSTLKFQNELQEILKTQDIIMSVTQTSKEKFKYSNDVCKEQIETYKTNIDKYGKYLSLIKSELSTINTLLIKIKNITKLIKIIE